LNSSHEDEKEVLLRCRRGEKQAFEIIVKKYMKRAYFIALGLVGQHEDALDLSQEAFIRAYRNIKKFNPEQQFFPWFYQILKNLCFNHLKKIRNHRLASLQQITETELAAQRNDDFDPNLLVERNEIKDRVWKAIGQLGEKHREIIILRHFQNLSYGEIAEALFCSKGTVMSRLYYARKALKEILDHET